MFLAYYTEFPLAEISCQKAPTASPHFWKELAVDIDRHGLRNPLILSPQNNRVMVGRNRYRALHLLSHTHCPVLILADREDELPAGFQQLATTRAEGQQLIRKVHSYDETWRGWRKLQEWIE